MVIFLLHCELKLPFRDFLLTAKGFVKLDDETELDPSKLKSVRFVRLSLAPDVDVVLLPAAPLTRVLFCWRCFCQVGFAIADQKEGDFELRIQWIKAVADLGLSDKDDYKDDDDDDQYVCARALLPSEVSANQHLSVCL